MWDPVLLMRSLHISQLSKSKQLSKERWVRALGFHLGLNFVALTLSPKVLPFGGCWGAPVMHLWGQLRQLEVYAMSGAARNTVR